MADRFWRGGSGTWSNASTTNWSTTSGGGGGASAPTSTDNVFFDANSGTGTVTVGTSPACANMDASATTILTFSGTGTLTCTGNFTLKSGMTISGWTGTITVNGTGAQTLTFAGNTLACSFTINSNAGSYTLQDNFSAGTGNTLTLTLGTFDANGKTVTTGLFNSANSNVRTLTMGTGQWTVTGANVFVWNVSPVTNLTFNVGTLNIICNYSGSTGTRFIQPGSLASGFPSFSVTAGTDIVGTASNVQDLDFTGFAGQISPQPLNIAGNIKMPAGVVWNSSSASAISFTAQSGSKTIDMNGVVIAQPVTIGTSAATTTWTLSSNFAVEAARTLTFAIGTLVANNFNVTIGAFAGSNGNTRTLNMGTGTWEITSTATATVWTQATTTGLTFVCPANNTIKLSGSTANVRTFSGGGLTYGNIWITNATTGGQVNFVGSNTFNNFRQNDATPQTVKFTAATTTTVSSWTAYGTASNLFTIDSITAATHTLAKAGGGFICADFLSVKNSIGSPSGAWYAGINSTNVSGNSGWTFASCPCGGFFALM